MVVTYLRIGGILFVLFLILLIVTGQGVAAADIVTGVWDGTADVIRNFAVFFRNLG